MHPWEASDGRALRRKNTEIFRGGSVDCGLNSVCGTERDPFDTAQCGEKKSWSMNRNHQSLGYSVLIRGWSACLFLGQIGVNGATFLPESFASPISKNDVYYNCK